jgi:hypothetical protein
MHAHGKLAAASWRTWLRAGPGVAGGRGGRVVLRRTAHLDNFQRLVDFGGQVLRALGA